MTGLIAKQIASLVNEQNNLPNAVKTEDIHYGDYFYISKDLDNVKYGPAEIVACVRAKRMSFFAVELKHLSVNPVYKRKGYGELMIDIVENEARSKQIPMVFATTCVKNDPINNLFKKLNYTLMRDFLNSKTGRVVHVWGKNV
jgi:N-acetylglutamate synthase-like GNAT family acetyltransferase